MSRIVLMLVVLAGLNQSVLAKQERAGEFDYYTLALSWSPTFCRSPAGQRNPSQCSAGRRFAFVVHGLWPQFTRGWPSFCRTPERWVDDRQIRDMFDIMPSKGLIIHQWKKHGSCSGLSQDGYFTLTRELFAKIRVPARYLSPTDPVEISPRQLVTDFLKTNRELRADMISVQCGNSRATANLRELRICFNRKGELAACGSNERRQCRAETLILPPVR
ncbi:MAG: ribonuclease T2 [Rhizobiales bacterium]|nr:ribonuclease T2 [Hyphomicrobiales bacterium]